MSRKKDGIDWAFGIFMIFTFAWMFLTDIQIDLLNDRISELEPNPAESSDETI